MELMFHLPYILRDVLVVLAVGLPWAVWMSVRRGDRRQARRRVLLFVGLALLAWGGIALTELVPNARAADRALVAGVTLLGAGAASVLGAALGGLPKPRMLR